MKVFTTDVNLLGKKAYKDERVDKLAEKFSSKKTTPLTMEFTDQDKDACDVLFIDREKLISFIIEDMEKGEALAAKTEGAVKDAVNKALTILGEEKVLSENLSGEEKDLIREYSFVTAKPVVFAAGQNAKEAIFEVLRCARFVCFFTVGPKEARAWMVKQGDDIVAAAAKIHSDLARGFIRAEIYNVRDMDTFKNMDDAKQRGYLKVVGREYIVEDGDVVNIKFSV